MQAEPTVGFTLGDRVVLEKALQSRRDLRRGGEGFNEGVPSLGGQHEVILVGKFDLGLGAFGMLSLDLQVPFGD